MHGIQAPIAQSDDEKFLFADAILDFRDVGACAVQGSLFSFHTALRMRGIRGATCVFRADARQKRVAPGARKMERPSQDAVLESRPLQELHVGDGSDFNSPRSTPDRREHTEQRG